MDFSGFDLDAPFPDIPQDRVGSQLSGVQKISADAKRRGLTLRQTALRLSAPSEAFKGDPEQVADAMQLWLESGAADGFVIYETLPGQLERLVEHVVPILQSRGVFHADYEGVTLRENLGLTRPVSPHAAKC
jgi:alkanesulfonate monooxygenase SsuD/methylene tetrahydromethanopterin reductase-like flavin-dependent oxidoreductase (luciferase family)